VRHRLTLVPWVIAGALLAPGAGRAYDQQISSSLWAEGYSVEGRDGTAIRRRRIVEDLHLAAWNLLPGSDDPYYEGPRLSIELAVRMDTDFAVGATESDPDIERSYVPGLTPLRVAVMLGFAEARGLWGGSLDLRGGRQVRFDTIGLLGLDGIEARVHLPDGLLIAVYWGYEIRGGDLLGYDQLELDGVDSGGRHDMAADRYADRVDPEPRMVVGAEASWIPRRWLDVGAVFRSVGLSEPLADQRFGGRVGLGDRPIRGEARVVWSPMLDRRDDAGEAFAEGTVVREADVDLSVAPHEAVDVRAEYRLYRPTFEADSIFNVFDLAPQNDLGLRVAARFGGSVSTAAWGFARLADGSGGLSGRDDASWLSGVGGGLGGNYWASSQRLSARVSWVREWGEDRVGAEIGGAQGFLSERLWVGLRASCWHIDDHFSERLSGNVIGYVLSVRFRVAQGARVLGELENYWGAGRVPRFVVMAMLQLDLWR